MTARRTLFRVAALAGAASFALSSFGQVGATSSIVGAVGHAGVHRTQLTPSGCVPASVTMLLAAHGEDLDQAGFEAEAASSGHLGPSGMKLSHAAELLRTSGHDVDAKTQDLDGLRQSLTASGPVVVGVDLAELTPQGGDAGVVDAGHAILVIAFDEGTDKVIVNDPLELRGGTTLTIDQFTRAWGDAGNWTLAAA